jgi:hypothetical protein
MVTDRASRAWLLFLAQLPSSPSSARVALWRRLHAIGAAGILNGSWVLPHTTAHLQFFEKLQATVRKQGGKAFVLTVSEPSPEVAAMMVECFRADRGREYDEFAERCGAFLTEISKETRAGKFTFAELEEGEQDLDKLVRWRKKIQARDFFPDERWPQSDEMLKRCRGALEDFSRAVYDAAEEVEAPPDPAAADHADWRGDDADVDSDGVRDPG